jgi:TPR repeat protein
MITPLIEKGTSKVYLLEHLCLAEVTHEVLWEFMEKLKFETFDENLWKLMKQASNSGYLNPHRNCPYPMSRWEEKPILSTQRETLALLAKIDSYRVGGKSRLETCEELKQKQEEIKKENEKLKAKLKERMHIVIKQGVNQLKVTQEHPENRTKSAEIFRLMGNKGGVDGKWMYGVCRLKGIGTEPNPQEAKGLFGDAVNLATRELATGGLTEERKKSLEDGLKAAKFWLTFVMDNQEEIVKILEELVQQEFKPAMFWYGKHLFEGEGIEQDREKGKSMIKSVAESGNSFWAKHHARIIREGLFDYRKVENEAIKFDNLAESKVTDVISVFNPGMFDDMNP